MYHLKDNRIRLFYIMCITFLWITVSGLTALAAEIPGGGTAVDGTIRDVAASEVSKGSEIVNVSSLPGEPENRETSFGPVGSQSPHKAEAPGNNIEGVRISSDSPASASSGNSPVITCGSNKAAASLSKEAVNPNVFLKGASLGMFTTTGYCLCEECSGGFELTYSGTVPQARHTVSADLDLFPIGTRLMIGDIVYTVEDIGSSVTGAHIDIFYDNHEDAMAHGRQLQEVFAVQ